MHILRDGLALFYTAAYATTVAGQRPDEFASLNEPSASEFRWRDITPSKSLAYSPCYEDFQCARLDLPLDWNATDPELERLALAVMKLPAKVPVTDSRYGGPILMNPGGPGGSGVSLMLRAAKAIQRIVDAAYDDDSDNYVIARDSARYFDIMSFDPRAVGNTTPFHTCFFDLADHNDWNTWSQGMIGTDEGSFNSAWVRYLAKNMNCAYDALKNPNGSKIAHFAGTPSVVRDMVEIIERHGEWREAQGLEKLSPLRDQHALLRSNFLDNNPFRRSFESLKWAVGEERLNYWGFSYGTVLGATFATMQPHRAHRVVLDGVDDADDYYSGEWKTNLVDTDKVMDTFFTFCSQSGPETCAMHAGSSPNDVRKRWDKIIKRITEKGPIPVAANGTIRGPDIITLSDIQVLVSQSLYQPIALFPTLAEVMAPLSQDDGTAFANRKHSLRRSPVLNPRCDRVDPYRPECYFGDDYGEDQASAIICLDGGAESMANMTRSKFKEYWAGLYNQSIWNSARWAMIRMACAGSNIRSNWKIPHAAGSNATRENATLFVTNTHDNVTPMRSALKMAARFAGSGLLHIDIDGHTSMANPSLCAGKAIRRYFQTGQLPAADAKPCLPQIRPFVDYDGPNLEPRPKDGLAKGDAELLGALWDFSGVIMGRKKPRKPSSPHDAQL